MTTLAIVKITFIICLKVEVEGMEVSNIKKIETLISLHIKTAMEDVTSITAFNDEWRHLSEPHLNSFKSIRKAYENRFKDIIRAGIDNNEIKVIDPAIILYTILSSVRWLYDWYQPEGKLTPTKVENNIIKILMSGIVK